MAYLKTVIKRLVVALCVLVLTGYVHACWGLALKLGDLEQVRMRPPSMRAYAQRGAPDQGGMRPPSEAHSCAHHMHSTHPVVVAAETRQLRQLHFQRHVRIPTHSQSW